MNETIKINAFEQKNKLLLIDEEVIRFNEKELDRIKISGIKYWISAIEFYKFPIGKKYHIGFRTEKDQIDIILKSYFGFGNSYFTELCNKIIEEVWQPITTKIINSAVDFLISGNAVNFGYCTISKEGVLINKKSSLSKKQLLISWEDLHYQKKYNRLVLENKCNYKLWTNLYFKESWNIEILIALLDWLTNEDGLKEILNKESMSKNQDIQDI